MLIKKMIQIKMLDNIISDPLEEECRMIPIYTDYYINSK